jgi:quinoprotein glucose dehydrogenase
MHSVHSHPRLREHIMKLRLLLGLCAAVCVSGLFAQESTQSSWGAALWIWDQPNAQSEQQDNEPRYFRHRVALGDVPAKAELWVSVDNTFTAYVNGTKVGSGSEWASPGRFDVAKLLKKGDNVIAIEGRNGGGVAGAIARLWVKMPDKKETIYGTGAGTRVSRLVPDGWTAVNFDDKAWAAASVLGESGMAPWNLSGSSAQPVAAGGSKLENVTSDGKIKERLSAALEQKEFRLPKDFVIELVADEPLVINPVCITLDDKGRMIVSESHTYRYGPSGSPVKPFKNPVVRLEPKADGKSFERVVIADGFDDPVMGIQVKGDKMWVTANNYLYRYDYPETGPATNKTTLVVDKNKAWNPFGMFVLEFGPDGLLYMSVGDHKVALEGPTNKIDSRGTSGVIVRMNPDGSNMERLTQGFRVPYSFEMDPFGQLWLLSNGEGNPNRFARIIPGVDYHCYTRGKVDNNWLAGNHPLAPPVFELMRGANTQLLRYYGAAYPKEYWGSLLLDNWGAHGFHGPNRGIFRYVPDEKGHIALKESFVSCNDPHFRPAHICLDPDGNLLIADWYGRDDESDLTGRIWRVRYTGKVDAAPTVAKFDSDSDRLNGLGSRNHITRQNAMSEFGPGSEEKLAKYATDAKNSLGAANALWALSRIGTEQAASSLIRGITNDDPKVRRLSIDLYRRANPGKPDEVIAKQELAVEQSRKKIIADSAIQKLMQLKLAKGFLEVLAAKDPDAGVRLEAAVTLQLPEAIINAVKSGAASDQFLRYQAASNLARNCSLDNFMDLLGREEPDVRSTGLIAVDVACYENTPAKKAALAALSNIITDPGKLDTNHILFLVQQHGDASLLPTLEKFILREDIPAAATTKAMIVYRGIAGKLPAVAGKRFLEAVQKGAVSLATPADHLTLIELLETEGPTPLAVEQLGKEIRLNIPQVKPAALTLARKFGPKSGELAGLLWPAILNPKNKAEDSLDSLATVAIVESPKAELWAKLLDHGDPVIRTDAVRWWRSFKKNPELIKVLQDRAGDLVKADAGLSDDLATVFREFDGGSATHPTVPKDDGKRDKAELAKLATEAMGKWSQADRTKHALLGKQVFERALCTKCHTAVTQNTPLAPSLKGVGSQKIDYLVESILEPSKIIKTGFETEVIVTNDGKSLSGLVKDEGDHLRVRNADVDVRVRKADIDTRAVQKRSIMPEGQETQLSRREFVDLIAYLSTLK